MIIKNKRWRFLALFAVLAMVVAACGETTEETTTTADGGADATTTTESTDDTMDETTTTEASAGGGTVTGAISEPPAIDPQLTTDSGGAIGFAERELLSFDHRPGTQNLLSHLVCRLLFSGIW